MGKSSKKRTRAVVASATAVVVLAGGYLGAAAARADHIAAGTTIGGVAVGGKTKAAATNALKAEAASTGRTPVTIYAAGKKLSIVPADSGLALDYSGALAGQTGFSLNPSTVWKRWFGDGDKTELSATVDKAKLTTAIARAGEVIKGSPKEGSVSFVDGSVKVVRSSAGHGVNAAALADQIAADWPMRKSYVGQVSEQQPTLSNTTIDTFVSGTAKPAIASPVTVKAGNKTAKLSGSALADLLTVTSAGGKLSLGVDQAKLTDALGAMSETLATPPEDARYQTVNGKETVVPAKDGTTVDPAGADQALLAALKDGSRTMTVKTKPATAKVTEAMLKTVGNQQMSEFVSNFPTGASNAARTHNIRTGLAKINGMVVAPGQQFSLLKALMPIDASNGFINAPVLVNGKDELGMGGGISQVSTTMYNATFFAGLKEDEHTAHAYWISRYPMGREATLWVPTIDNKWTNDSGAPIKIWAGIEGHAAVIRLYGKKVFTVTSSTSSPFNIVPPQTRTITTAGCIPQPPVNGFSVTVTRVVRQGDKVVKNESLTTRYIPADRIICTNP